MIKDGKKNEIEGMNKEIRKKEGKKIEIEEMNEET